MSKNNGNTKAKTWLITGASSGLGYTLAEYALQQGDRVALGARSQAAMTALAARYPDRALALALDVTNAEQRAAAVQQTEQRFGVIDVLVNNAGIDYIGAIEEQEERDYRAIFEVNFFGAVSMLRLVLPGMRARKQGTIVNVSSMDGIASLPVNGFYSSSKFALEGLTESLWQEIEPIGLRAFLVELGSFRTGLADRTKFSGAPIEAYAATSGAFRQVMATMTPEMFPGDPVRAAEAIYEVVASDRPRHWVILGSDAYRLIGAKLDKLRAEYDAGREMAFRTDYPNSGPPIL
jgi:NAD(P)-dependent dehydrogenase (short-subunit alcohol dehydrogenase family)